MCLLWQEISGQEHRTSLQKEQEMLPDEMRNSKDRIREIN